MPEYRQLSFDLPGLVTSAPPPPPPPEVAPAPAPAPESRKAPSQSVDRGSVRRRLRKMGEGKYLDVGLTQACRDLLLGLGLRELADKVVVCWNRRLKTTAGLAYHQEARIELNQQLLEFPPDEPEQTMRHELAHLIAHHRAGRRRIRPHGIEWQMACEELGIPGEDRCHSLPFRRRQMRKKFAYRCRKCRTVVPRVRALARDSACYPCCRKFNRGNFSQRFLLERITLAEARVVCPDAPWAV